MRPSTQIEWGDLTASYSDSERAAMRGLTDQERWWIHALKANFDAKIELGAVAAGSAVQTQQGEASGASSLVGDVPPPALKKAHWTKLINAVVWTGGNHKIFKKKGDAQLEIAAWRDDHKARGWDVKPFHTGYLASKGDDRRCVQLHEYIAETKERIA